MPCNVLQPPSTFYSSYCSHHPLLPLSPPPPPSYLLPFSFSLLLSPLLLYSPLSFLCRGGVRSKFNFHRATPLTYHPLFLFIRHPPPFPSSFVLSSSLHSGNPEDSGKEATGCIPCDKLRGSIIHGNLLRLCLRRGCSFLASPTSCDLHRERTMCEVVLRAKYWKHVTPRKCSNGDSSFSSS